MSPRYLSARHLTITACLISLFLVANFSRAGELASPSSVPGRSVGPSPAELAQFVRGAIDTAPYDAQARFRTDQAALKAAFAELEAYLARSRQHGRAWHDYLRNDELAAALAEAEVGDLAQLEAILRRYQSGHAGLELAPFHNVHDALVEYCCGLRVVRLLDPSAEYTDRLTRLADLIESNRRRGRSLDEIASSIAWLDEHRMAPEVVAALREEYVQPNLFAQISGLAICGQLDRQLDERMSIRNMINGARVTGTGHLRGQVRFELEPNADVAAIRMKVRGTIDTVTTARSGPVGLEGWGRTLLTGDKLLLADGTTVRSQPAVVSAQTALHPTGVWSTFRGPVLDRVARRVGWQRNLDSLPSSERTVSRRAERDLQQRIDAEATELVTKINQTFIDELRVPLSKQGIFPANLRLSSTRDHVRLGATVVDHGQLAALSAAPPLNGQALVSVTMHESLFNNMADTTLSGRTLQSTELAGVLAKMLGEAPFGFDNVDGVPWELTVAEGTPLEVRLADGGLTVTISCRKITAGPEVFDVPFAVSARYRASIEGPAVVLHREGDLGVAGPALGGIGKLSDGVTDSQAIIAERFRMLFQEELRFTVDQLPFALPIEDKLVPTQLEMQEGWMLVSFDKEPATLRTEIVSGR